MSITQEELKELLHYDPETGVFIWKVDRGSIFEGDIAGCITRNGYNQIGIKGKEYLTHRLVWLYMYGRFPNGEIDHINRDRLDNRLCNLRDVNKFENGQNSGFRRHNTSGFTGVSYVAKAKKWQSKITCNKKQIYLGLFSTPEEAHEVYLKAKTELHISN